MNAEHLGILKQGVCTWNRWREENPSIVPELDEFDFNPAGPTIDAAGRLVSRPTLRGINLSWASIGRGRLGFLDLTGANFHHATLFKADFGGSLLVDADFTDAHLDDAVMSSVDLTGAHLDRATCFGAKIIGGVSLRGASLTGTFLRRANLAEADLTKADLTGANLIEANLTKAKLVETTLTRAKLLGASFVETNLEGATLTGSNVYGISAWGITGAPGNQDSLIITPEGEPTLMVDDLEVAQFVYLLVKHAKLRKVITAVSNKAVLILGRFSDAPRKAFLDALASAVREQRLLPIIYDFERPQNQDWTETVLTLASMSLFVIVDLTNPISVPLELQAVIPNCMVPFVPLLKKGEKPFSMFVNLQKKYNWVLDVVRYNTEASVVSKFDGAILKPALKARLELNKRKAETLKEVDVDDLPDGSRDEK